jgi:hypothetical protein
MSVRELVFYLLFHLGLEVGSHLDILCTHGFLLCLCAGLFGFLGLDFTGWSFCTWQIYFARVFLGVFLSCPESHARARKGCLRWHGSVDSEEVDVVVQRLWVSTWSRSEFFQPQPTQRHRRFLWLEQVVAGAFQFTSIGHVHPYDTDLESLLPLP